MYRVNNRFDGTVFVKYKQFGKYLQYEAARVAHLIEQEIVQIEAGQRSVLVVELQRGHLVHVPPVLGQGKVVFAFAVQIFRRAVKYVFAKWFGDADAFVCVLTTQAVQY